MTGNVRSDASEEPLTSPHQSTKRKRLGFAVESSTDARLLEGLAESFDVSVLVRRLEAGAAIGQTLSSDIVVVPLAVSRAVFCLLVFSHLLRRRGSYDVILAQGYGPVTLAANLAAWVTGTPTVMLVCSPQEEYYRCRRGDRLLGSSFRRYHLFALQVIAHANAIAGGQYVVLSEYLASIVRQHGRRRPIAVCPVYGVDSEVFHPTVETKASLRRTLNLPEVGSLVLFSSRIAPEKDVDTLLQAINILLAEGRDVWLVNTSGGYIELRDRAQRYGVDGRLIARPAVDPRESLAGYYQVADVCVQASRAEGLGFSPLEALSCGTPVVAAAVGGLRETILDEETGWTYPAGNATALAREVAFVLDHPADAVERTDKGRALVLRRFERRAAFEQIYRILDTPGRTFSLGRVQSRRAWCERLSKDEGGSM